MARDYTNDTKYEEQPDQIRKRELRNDARRKLEQSGRVHKGDGNDVNHIHMLKADHFPTKSVNSEHNLNVQTQKKNRGWRRGKHGY